MLGERGRSTADWRGGREGGGQAWRWAGTVLASSLDAPRRGCEGTETAQHRAGWGRCTKGSCKKDRVGGRTPLPPGSFIPSWSQNRSHTSDRKPSGTSAQGPGAPPPPTPTEEPRASTPPIPGQAPSSSRPRAPAKGRNAGWVPGTRPRGRGECGGRGALFPQLQPHPSPPVLG